MDDLHRDFRKIEDLMGMVRADLDKLAIPTGALLRLQLDRLGGLQHRLTMPGVALLTPRTTGAALPRGRIFFLERAIRRGRLVGIVGVRLKPGLQLPHSVLELLNLATEMEHIDSNCLWGLLPIRLTERKGSFLIDREVNALEIARSFRDKKLGLLCMLDSNQYKEL